MKKSRSKSIVNPKDIHPRPRPEDMPLAGPGEQICGIASTEQPDLRCQRKAGHDGPHTAVLPDAAEEIARGVRAADEQMREYRREHFAVKCQPSSLRDGCGEPLLILSMTANGYQWESLGVYPSEVPAVVSALQQADLEQKWPQIIAALGSGKPTPFADCFVAFQTARDRFDKACRNMTNIVGIPTEENRELAREEWRLSGVHLLSLFDDVLRIVQTAGLMPPIPSEPYQPQPRTPQPPPRDA